MEHIIPPSQPRIPPQNIIAFPKSNILTIILLLGILTILTILTIYVTTKPEPINITCKSPDQVIKCQQTPPETIVAKNNIQASHTYQKEIYTYNNMICIKADEIGDLWGSSMQPTFYEGNTAITINYTNQTLHTGDLIRFFRYTKEYPNCEALKNAQGNNSLGGAWINTTMAVIHRINAIYDEDIVTQGDNLNEQETIQRCQITDIVIGVIFT